MYNSVIANDPMDSLPGAVTEYADPPHTHVHQVSSAFHDKLTSLKKKVLSTKEVETYRGVASKLTQFQEDMESLLQKGFSKMQSDCEELCQKHLAELKAGDLTGLLKTPSEKFRAVRLAAAELDMNNLARVSALKSDHARSRSDKSRLPTQCNNCGNIFAPDAAFCRKCGKKRMALVSESDRHEQEEIQALNECFALTEKYEADMERINRQGMVGRLRKAVSFQRVDMLLDFVATWFILANAIYMGFSMDQPQKPTGQFTVYEAVEISFSVFFVSELSIKVCLQGCKGFFCGEYAKSNLFDLIIVVLDVIMIFVSLVLAGSALPLDPGIFRLVRLGKLSRILRVLRYKGFSTLLTMIQGMLGGMSTLAWSLVLYFITIYITALVFRESLGRQEHPIIQPYFDSVPRSLYTVFRCSFGDCTALTGVPIFEHVQQKYGGGISLMYSAFLFGVTIGLFNVISAIFVQSTLDASEKFSQAKKGERLKDDLLWARSLSTLIRRLIVHAGGDCPSCLSKSVDEILQLEVAEEVVNRWAADPETKAALRDLEIDPMDDDNLSDILDPDGNNRISVIELQEGIRRLRGITRRSDILRVDLMVRNIQRMVKDLHTNDLGES